MQTYTLTRSDFVLAHNLAFANLQALAHLRKHPHGAPPQKKRSNAWKTGVSFLAFLPCWVLFQIYNPGPRVMGYVLCAVLSFALAAGVLWWWSQAYTRRLYQTSLADHGFNLSPRSVVVSEAGIEEHGKGTVTHLEWSALLMRQESDTMFYLFLDPGVCLVYPKAALPYEAQALIMQRVPAGPRLP